MVAAVFVSMVLAVTLSAADGLVENGGFEAVHKPGKPAHWKPFGSFGPAMLTDDSPRTGKLAGRIVGDGTQRAWRHVIDKPRSQLIVASGWFRARGVLIKTNPDGWVRFYFHILYKDRPYGETTHISVDLPTGSYGWRRFAARLTPRTDYPVDQIWITVTGNMTSGTLDFDDIAAHPAPFLGGFTALEWAQSGKAKMLRDMGQVEPKSALTGRAERGKWKLVPYEIGGDKGRMVWASALTQAPELTLPLDVRGWHAVFVGVASPMGVARHALLRLSRDSAFTMRARTKGQVEEVFFKADDLTGQSLHIAQQDGCEPVSVGVAYVKLVPLTDEEVATIKAERADSSLRRLVASIDGFSFIHGRRPTTRLSLLREVEAYRHSDFGTLILQVGGADMVNYPSNMGQMRGMD
ncbi:MAG: hypothetical protein KAI66_16335, partial [Lentisphaeria bacterium]|nr:hypothetical protein [Lentisphaeria bacterium]